MKKLLTIAAAGLLALSAGTAQAYDGWHHGHDRDWHRDHYAAHYAPRPVRYYGYYGPAYYVPPPPPPVVVYPVAAPVYYYPPAPVTSFFFGF